MSKRDEHGFAANPELTPGMAAHSTNQVTATLIDATGLDTAAQHELRSALRDVLADYAAAATPDSSSSNAAERRPLWDSVSTILACAGPEIDADGGQRQRMWDTLSVAAEELGRVPVDVPFLTSCVTAATMTGRTAQRALTSQLVRGATTAVFLTPYEQPFRVSSSGTFHDGRVWASIPAVAGVTDADTMLILCGDKLVSFEAPWAALTSAASLDATRALVNVTVSGAHGTVLAEGDGALFAVSMAAEAASAMLAVEQASVADTCARLVDTSGTDAERLRVGVDKAAWAARYAVQCLAAGDPHTAVAVATARMVCSTVSFRAAHAAERSNRSKGRAAALLAERARGSARAFGGPQWHRRRLAQLLTSPVPVDKPLSRRIR